MDNSIHHSETIFKSLEKINLTNELSKIAITHIISILIAIFSIGYRGKTVDFESHSDCHRTTIGYFLNKGKWDESVIENTVKRMVIDVIYEEAKRTGKPVFCVKTFFQSETSDRGCVFPLFALEEKTGLWSSGNQYYAFL